MRGGRAGRAGGLPEPGEVGAVVTDVVVVGAGSAGCVLAARASASGDRSVVLIEAGPDYPSLADLPADITDGVIGYRVSVSTSTADHASEGKRDDRRNR